MSKFQREVDEHKKQIQQTGGAYYSNKSSQAIAKPSWMNKPVSTPADKSKPFNMNSNPLTGRATRPHYEILDRSVPVLGGYPEMEEFPLTGNTATKAVSVFEELIPLLRGFIP